MIAFTAYDNQTGRVLFGGKASQPELIETGEISIISGIEHSNGWIEGGNHFDLPVQPSPNHVFNYTTKQWEDPRTLADLKAAKNAAINAARLKANQSHFTFAGKQIAVDPLSRSDIDAAHGAILMLGAMPGGWPGGWKAMDNTIVPIADLATWGQFYGAMVAQGTANFAHAQALKAQLASATTPEEVAAVPDW